MGPPGWPIPPALLNHLWRVVVFGPHPWENQKALPEGSNLEGLAFREWCRSVVVRILRAEEVKNVLRTVSGLGGKQTVLWIFKRAAATNGHEPRVPAPGIRCFLIHILRSAQRLRAKRRR